jgi:hypothetical protein
MQAMGPPKFTHFAFAVKFIQGRSISGLSSKSKQTMLVVMVRETTNRGTKKCSKTTVLVSCADTIPIISVTLMGQYWALNQFQNDYLGLTSRLPIQ